MCGPSKSTTPGRSPAGAVDLRNLPGGSPFYCGERYGVICVVLGPEKPSTYCREYASGFSEPGYTLLWVQHLPASRQPRDEGILRQAPSVPAAIRALGSCRNRDPELCVTTRVRAARACAEPLV